METDWKKKYEEALNKARELNGTVADGRDFLAEIFPELAESEDERIRQELVKYIEDYPNLPSGHYSRADFFAYLEKQKPKWSEDKFPKNIEADAVQFCFDNGINITPYQAKQIATHYLMVGHNEGYIEGRKNAHIPAKELGLPSSMDFRQEWSEEDEEIFNLTITHLLSYAYPNNPIYRKEAEKCVAWLKSFRLQPKKEWSEEDKAMIERLIRHTQKEFDELCNDRYGHQEIISDLKESCRERMNWLENRLKSLHPRWKPSEEQMEALNYAIAEWDGGKRLEGLYALRTDLKKLK